MTTESETNGGSSPADGAKSLRSLVRRGVAWSALDVGIGRFSNFALGLVVARILIPADFGVFAVALVVHAIVVNVSELGVSTALVREDNESVDRIAPTVVTIAFLSSALLGAMMFLAAPVFASLLGATKAAAPIEVMALTLPLAGISAVPAALLKREFRTDKMFVANFANLVVTCAVAIPLGLAGWGAMALAWSWVASQVATSVILIAFMPAKCRPGFDRKQTKRLILFGLPLAGASVLTFAVQNVDYVVVGRVLGSVRLGLYVLAFNISGWPMNLFGSVVRSVALPAFSRLQDDERLPDYFAQAVNTVATITFPVCLLLGALSFPLVQVVYGHKWAGAGAALVGLSILGAFRTVIEPFSDYLVALGRTRAVLLAQIPWLVALTVGLVVATNAAGIGGAGGAQAVVAAGIVVPVYAVLLRRAGIKPSIIVRSLGPPLAWSGAAAAVAWLVGSQFANPWLACLVGGSAGLLLYVVAHRTLLHRILGDLVRARKGAPTAECSVAAAEMPVHSVAT